MEGIIGAYYWRLEDITRGYYSRILVVEDIIGVYEYIIDYWRILLDDIIGESYWRKLVEDIIEDHSWRILREHATG